MTNSEFSNEFDVLYDIVSNKAPGIDEYEKSVFLTIGQNDVIKSYFNPRENKPQQGFDDSRKRQMDFSALMKSKTLEVCPTDSKFDSRSLSYRIPNDLLLFVNEACKDKNYRYVVMPISFNEYDRLMLKPYQYPVKRGVWRLITDSAIPSVASISIPNGDSSATLSIKNSTTKEVTFTISSTSATIETETDDNGYQISIKDLGIAPVITETATSVDIKCVISNAATDTSQYWSRFLLVKRPWTKQLYPYVGELKGQDGSIFPNVPPSAIGSIGKTVIASPATPFIELIGKFDKESLNYTVRYLRKPRPIILTPLEDYLSIQGITTESTCELDESIHREILERAVELAKAAHAGDLQSQIVIGQASKTDIGAVQTSK